jgi:hypothetical protein
MEHPNAELYRRVTAAFQSGDIDTMKGLLAASLRWHEAGNPEVMGRAAVLDQMSGAVKRIDGDVAVHDVLANDEHVIALINVALRKPDGLRLPTPPSRSPTSATGSSPRDGPSWTRVLPMRTRSSPTLADVATLKALSVTAACDRRDEHTDQRHHRRSPLTKPHTRVPANRPGPE